MPKKPHIPEKEIQSYFLNLLETYGVLHWRVPVDGIRSGSGGVRRKSPLAGFPDIAGVTAKGKFWAAEIKRYGEEPSDKQQLWLDNLKRSNAMTAIIDSHEGALAFLMQIKQN